MKKRAPRLRAFVLSASLLSAGGFAQNRPADTTQPPAQQQPQSNPYEDEVVRITSSLVQFDAVVTDKSGKAVTDLRAEEFEVLADGKAQQVTNFSFVCLDAPAPTGPARGARNGDAAPDTNIAAPPPAARLRPEHVRRTIALVIDDLGLSFESIAAARGSLKKFVDEQMRPDDLVAIIRTSAGVGALQQFTSDKRVLYAAIERVKWYPSGRAGVSTFASIEKDEISEANRAAAALMAASPDARSLTPAGSLNGPDGATNLTDLRDVNDLTDRYREELFAAGTLGALNFVVRGLKELPGRKSVLLFSDSLPVFRKDGKSDRVLEALRRLTDLANRASVVIYSMDTRGLQTLSLKATDNVSSLNSSAAINKASDERTASYFESQNGLNYLAEQTGGLFIRNTNDVAEGVRAVLQDQRGFYLIGYQPDASTFDGATGAQRFHELTVRVKRPGLKVRTRNGFYGIPEEAARPTRRTRDEQLYGAITSPFSSGELRVRLTSLFGNDAAAGSFVRSLLHIDADNISFAKGEDGAYRAVIDVLVITFGDTGQIINQVNSTDTIRVEANKHEALARYGFDYIVNVPVPKPGAYQLRAAVRDTATERVGSASQFIEVPDLGDNRLALSGIVLSGEDLPAVAKTNAGAASPFSGALLSASSIAGRKPGAAVAAEPDAQAGPATRRLRRGSELFYNFAVYNARTKGAGALPRLTSRTRLFRDGRELFAGKPLPIEIGEQRDMKRLLAGGRMKLAAAAKPGEYVLQVIVTDEAPGERVRVASQWIDFEIVE
jgi:VWFA-related protein